MVDKVSRCSKPRAAIRYDLWTISHMVRWWYARYREEPRGLYDLIRRPCFDHLRTSGPSADILEVKRYQSWFAVARNTTSGLSGVKSSYMEYRLRRTTKPRELIACLLYMYISSVSSLLLYRSYRFICPFRWWRKREIQGNTENNQQIPWPEHFWT